MQCSSGNYRTVVSYSTVDITIKQLLCHQTTACIRGGASGQCSTLRYTDLPSYNKSHTVVCQYSDYYLPVHMSNYMYATTNSYAKNSCNTNCRSFTNTPFILRIVLLFRSRTVLQNCSSMSLHCSS